MLVQLLDAKDFAEIKGEVVLKGQMSFNMNKVMDSVWSNGWCPVSRIVRDEQGLYFGKICNELVPTGIYSNQIVNMRMPVKY